MTKKPSEFKKQCPVCGCEQYYQHKRHLVDAVKKNKACKTCTSMSDECKDKKRQTNLNKYGVENPFQNKDIQNKQKQTNLLKYGVEYSVQNSEIYQKTKNTNLEKYGVEHYSKTKEFKEKTKKTMQENYGVEHYSQSDECKIKTKNTNLNKYRVEWVAQNPEVREKQKQTNLLKYGVDNYVQSNEFQIKSKKTRILNGYMYTDESFLSQIRTTKPETNITDVQRIEGRTWQFTDSSGKIWTKKCTSGILSVTPHKIDQFLSHFNSHFICKALENNLYEITNFDLNSLPFLTKELKQTYEFKQHFFPEQIIPDLLNKLTYDRKVNKRNIIDIESKFQCNFNKFKEYINYKFVEYYQHPLHECSKKEYNSLQLDHSIPQQFFKKHFPNNWELLSNHYTNVKYLKNFNKENQRKKDKYFFNLEEVLKWYHEGNIIFPEHLYDFEEEKKIVFHYK